MTTWIIGEAAAKCGLSPRTLRWYERTGLLDTKIGYYATCLAEASQAG